MFIASDFTCIILAISGFIRLVSCNEISREYEEAVHFDAMPGGAVLTQDIKMDGITCKFTYACQGGTKEGWQITMNRNSEKSKYLCSVQRPDGKSYLFFQSFKLELSGADVTEGNAMGPNFQPLKPSEFKVDLQQNSISDVAGKFGSQLEKVELYAKKSTSEL